MDFCEKNEVKDKALVLITHQKSRIFGLYDLAVKQEEYETGFKKA